MPWLGKIVFGKVAEAMNLGGVGDEPSASARRLGGVLGVKKVGRAFSRAGEFSLV